MKNCKDCQQLKNRTTNWNYTHGAMDPLPYLDDMIRPHKQLIFEKRSVDGAGRSSFIFRCHKCEQWWELLAWSAVGQLDIKPYIPEFHLSL